MKKILVLIISLLFMPLMALADGAAPYLKGYNARVSNPEGTYLYVNEDKKIFIKYDEVITDIYMEYLDENDILWADGEYGEEYGMVKVEDIKPVKEKVDLEDYKQEETLEMYVYKEGAYLYKGPSMTYNQIDGKKMLPVGTIVTIKYYDEVWGYVESNDLKGWVYIYHHLQDGVPFKEISSLAYINKNNDELLVVKDSVLKESPVSSKALIKVTANEKLTYKYYYNKLHERMYYVEYNNIGGWISLNDIAYETETSFFTPKEINVYSDTTENKFLFTLPSGITAKNNYITEYYPGEPHYSYINYNGKSGWINLEETATKVEKYYIMNTEEITLKDSAISSAREIKKIKSGTKLEVKYQYWENVNDEYRVWLYVSDGNTSGWVIKNNIIEADARKLYCNLYDDSVIYDSLMGEETDKVIKKGPVQFEFEYINKKTNSLGNESDDYWYYIVNNDYEGWVHTGYEFWCAKSKEELLNINNINEKENEKNNPIIEDEESKENFDDKQDLDDEEKEEAPSYSVKEIAIYCVCGAIVIALVAFVVIKIINQRKEMKKNLTSDINNDSSNIDEK
ncbi:MAG: hypothetical protein IJO33_03835 [Bacilli bacterium]|nr:hypothetical protein [Bacilli bacterium]